MRHYLLMSALCLIASCGPKPEVVTLPVYVPEELRREVVVRCVDGDVASSLGECALKKDAGLREANRRITAIDEILDQVEAGPK